MSPYLAHRSSPTLSYNFTASRYAMTSCRRRARACPAVADYAPLVSLPPPPLPAYRGDTSRPRSQCSHAAQAHLPPPQLNSAGVRRAAPRSARQPPPRPPLPLQPGARAQDAQRRRPRRKWPVGGAVHFRNRKTSTPNPASRTTRVTTSPAHEHSPARLCLLHTRLLGGRGASGEGDGARAALLQHAGAPVASAARVAQHGLAGGAAAPLRRLCRGGA